MFLEDSQELDLMEQDFQLRNVFNEKVVRQLGSNIASVYPEFDKKGFCKSIISQLASFSFGDRSNIIRDALREYLPKDYPQAVQILVLSLGPEIPHCELMGFDNFVVMSENDFIAKYGLDHFDISMHALYEMTKRFTAEGAIRAFIEKYPEQTLKLLEHWAEDKNCHVRRLVSEGTRPRLPLGTRLKQFVQDPRPVLLLLDKLKTDPELMVRRSVANNLNDIAKDNPELVVKTLRAWKKIEDEGTQWLIRHASRTLVKQGNKEAIALLGYSSDVAIAVSKLELDKTIIPMGAEFKFEFEVKSKSNDTQNLVIDYVIHHVKANGKLKPKVFKLAKKKLQAGETLHISKKHSLRLINTRKYYPGMHLLEIQVNGTVYKQAKFELR